MFSSSVTFVSNAAPKVVNFGLLTTDTRVQSQDVDISSNSRPVPEYLDMSCDSAVVKHGQKNTAELTGCILKLSIQTFQKLGVLLFTFIYRWQPIDHKHQVSGFSGTAVTKHNLANHYTETKQKLMFIFVINIL
jgi:hypothetical protein